MCIKFLHSSFRLRYWSYRNNFWTELSLRIEVSRTRCLIFKFLQILRGQLDLFVFSLNLNFWLLFHFSFLLYINRLSFLNLRYRSELNVLIFCKITSVSHSCLKLKNSSINLLSKSKWSRRQLTGKMLFDFIHYN